MHPRPDERHSCVRLSQDHVPEPGKRGQDSAHGGVGQDRNQRHSQLAKPGGGQRRLGHLEEGDHALLDAGPARRADNDRRQALAPSCIEGSRHLLADDAPHAAAQKAEVEHHQDHPGAQHPRPAGHHRVQQAGLGLRLGHLLLVGAHAVGEVKRIARPEVAVGLVKATPIRQLFDSLRGRHRCVEPAAGADQKLVQRCGALRAGFSHAWTVPAATGEGRRPRPGAGECASPGPLSGRTRLRSHSGCGGEPPASGAGGPAR